MFSLFNSHPSYISIYNHDHIIQLAVIIFVDENQTRSRLYIYCICNLTSYPVYVT